MSHVRPITAGLAFALFAALAHAGWSLLVLAGWAQPLVDLIFRLHFMKPVLQIAPFDWLTAAWLVVYAAVAGFIFGVVLAACWNGFTRLAYARFTAPGPTASAH